MHLREEHVFVQLVWHDIAQVCLGLDIEVRPHKLFISRCLGFRDEPARIENDPVYSDVSHLGTKVIHDSDVFRSYGELNANVWRPFEGPQALQICNYAFVDTASAKFVILFFETIE